MERYERAGRIYTGEPDPEVEARIWPPSERRLKVDPNSLFGIFAEAIGIKTFGDLRYIERNAKLQKTKADRINATVLDVMTEMSRSSGSGVVAESEYGQMERLLYRKQTPGNNDDSVQFYVVRVDEAGETTKWYGAPTHHVQPENEVVPLPGAGEPTVAFDYVQFDTPRQLVVFLNNQAKVLRNALSECSLGKMATA